MPAPRYEVPVTQHAIERPAIVVGAPVNLKYTTALPSRSNRALQLGLGIGLGVGVPVVAGAIVGITYLIMAAVGAGVSSFASMMSGIR